MRTEAEGVGIAPAEEAAEEEEERRGKGAARKEGAARVHRVRVCARGGVGWVGARTRWLFGQTVVHICREGHAVAFGGWLCTSG
eukprot:4809651-Prymnesium_polylepis.2